MKKKKKPTLYLKVRHFKNGSTVMVWVMVKDGAAHYHLMYGEIPEVSLPMLTESLGLEVEEETVPYEFPVRNDTLHKAQADRTSSGGRPGVRRKGLGL